jgi:DNA transposition AAA+ family ATPase
MTTLQETKQANPSFITKLKEYMVKEGISQSVLAKKIGYSTAAMNTYLNNKYEGSLDEFESTIEKFLNFNTVKRGYKKVKLDFRPTSVAKKLFNVARMCHFNGEIGMCFGASGLGKSTAVKEYARKNAGVIVIDPSEKVTFKVLLELIGKQIKLPCPQSGFYSHDAYMEQIIDKLNDSNQLMIIDEAENLDSSLFRVLRKIHDRCTFTFGLLFVGTTQLYRTLFCLSSKYEYVTNRISAIEALDVLTKEDVKMLVNQVFEDCEDDIIESFIEKSKNNARVLFSLLKRTNDIFINTEDKLNQKMITDASKWLLRG